MRGCENNAASVRFALTLVPFAGIAFLWFMGVVRAHLGRQEDQFFSTVFYGSGLLFLAMLFTYGRVAGGMLSAYALAPDAMDESGVIIFGRSIIYTITNVYAIRMAGVFMLSLGTIWVRTRAMPRVLVILTYLLAILLLAGHQSLAVGDHDLPALGAGRQHLHPGGQPARPTIGSRRRSRRGRVTKIHPPRKA